MSITHTPEEPYERDTGEEAFECDRALTLRGTRVDSFNPSSDRLRPASQASHPLQRHGLTGT